jgi:hypothetical protein
MGHQIILDKPPASLIKWGHVKPKEAEMDQTKGLWLVIFDTSVRPMIVSDEARAFHEVMHTDEVTGGNISAVAVPVAVARAAPDLLYMLRTLLRSDDQSQHLDEAFDLLHRVEAALETELA